MTDKDKCNSIRKLNVEYHREIREHKIKEKHAKNPTKESGETFQIGRGLNKVAKSCKNDYPLSKEMCYNLSQGKESWKMEMVKYRIFLRLSPKKKREYEKMITDLESNMKKECN